MGNDSWHIVGPNYPFNKWKYHWCRVLNPAVDAESNKSSLTAFWLPEMQRQREFSAPVLWRTCCDTLGTKSLPLPGFKEKKKKKAQPKQTAPNRTLAIVASEERKSESLLTANAGKTHPLKHTNGGRKSSPIYFAERDAGKQRAPQDFACYSQTRQISF